MRVLWAMNRIFLWIVADDCIYSLMLVEIWLVCWLEGLAHSWNLRRDLRSVKKYQGLVWWGPLIIFCLKFNYYFLSSQPYSQRIWGLFDPLENLKAVRSHFLLFHFFNWIIIFSDEVKGRKSRDKEDFVGSEPKFEVNSWLFTLATVATDQCR